MACEVCCVGMLRADRHQGKSSACPPTTPRRMSELRVIELLEGICDDLETVYTYNATSDAWVDAPKPVPSAEKAQVQSLQKRFVDYCGLLLDRHEEGLAQAIQAWGLDSAGVEAHLCLGLAGACPTPQDREL